MVKATARLLAVALLFACHHPVAAKSLAEYQPGDLAEQDIVATVPLTVTDLAQTELIRAQAAERVPAIFRMDPAVAPDAEAAFRQNFADSRERFLTAFEKKFHTRKVEGEPPAEVMEFCEGFPANRKYLPGSTQLHLAWARGGAGDELAAALLVPLQAALQQHIRPNAITAELKASPRVRLLQPDGSFSEVARSAVISLDRARTNLYAQFKPEDAPLARYLGGFLRPNCAGDVALTQAARTAASATLTAARQYAANDVIVRRGEAVTPQVKLALDELQARTPAVKTVYKTVSVPVPAEPVVRPWMLAVGGGAGVVAAMFAISYLIVRRRRGGSMSLVTTDEWRERALEAERRADRATAMVRTDLTSQLAKTLTNDLVKKLVEQRDDLLTHQQAAAAEMTALAERLEALDTPAQREFYQQRIGELEKQLADKDAQNRALLEEQIKAARRQLEHTQNLMRLN